MDTRTRDHNELVRKVLIYIHENHTGRYWGNETGVVKAEAGYHKHYGLIGSTDIIGFTGQGRAVFIEVKTGSAKLKDKQKNFRDITIANGCIHIVVYNEINSDDFNLIPRRKSGSING